ncbi:MAG: hypothetical protein ACRDPO_22600, partial [Streptosporangiaceae bacterium]
SVRHERGRHRRRRQWWHGYRCQRQRAHRPDSERQLGRGVRGGRDRDSGHRGTGQAVNATNDSGTLATIKAVNSGTNSGIHATSNGRGGVFGGSLAQIQLTPRSGATHPKGGSRGDLYADKSGRLWFCKKGGTTATWHQIA